MSLPVFKDSNTNLMLMQNNWSSQLNPMLVNPSLLSRILKKVHLISGSNTINHLLGRQLQGWRIIRQRAEASIYDDQDSNQQSQSTLVLITDNSVVVDLEVF